MGIKFSVHTDGMDAVRTAIAKACTRAEHVLAEQMEKDTQPFVPFRTGSLNERTKVIGNEIIYPGPYARYLYYGKVMVDENGNGPMKFVGNAQFDGGSVTHNGKDIGNTHKHSGVQTGGGNTGVVV